MVMVVVDGEQWITLRIVCRRLMKCVPEDDICGDGGGGLPNRCRPLRGWKTRPEIERRGRPNRHHSIPAPRERGLIQPFFR